MGDGGPRARLLAGVHARRPALRICPQCRHETEAPRCPRDGFATLDAARYAEPDGTEVLGTVFDARYRIDRLLGMGGMGAVYEAVQLSVDRPVAIKVLRPGLARGLRDVARFQQEARAVAALSHPNTIRLFDFGQVEDGSLFLVMELLRGETLEDLLQREAPLAPARVADIMAQVAEALVEAHAQGIVHRDLKPANLFMAELSGRQDFVKLLDFGIAKVTGERAADAPLTSTGVAVGSPRWIAPEQASGEPVTGQADIYTLGAIAFEMLTGRPLFAGRSATDLLVAHLQAPVPPISVQGRPLEGPLPTLVRACLAKLPGQRPPGATAVLDALRAMRGRWVESASAHLDAPAPGSAAPRSARGPTQELARPGPRGAGPTPRDAPAVQPRRGDTVSWTGVVEEVAVTSPVMPLAETGPVVIDAGGGAGGGECVLEATGPVAAAVMPQSAVEATAPVAVSRAGKGAGLRRRMPGATQAAPEPDQDEIPTDPEATGQRVWVVPGRRSPGKGRVVAGLVGDRGGGGGGGGVVARSGAGRAGPRPGLGLGLGPGWWPGLRPGRAEAGPGSAEAGPGWGLSCHCHCHCC
ncbi:MAG: protein kinase [Deltaproteobacteria bacterium]|nr:protein kinase [Deltaproteobacteria bacterium]